MQFTIEDNIDFFNALNSDEEQLDISRCLISNMPLQDNYVTLSCNHQFNYETLFEEIRNQKKVNYLETKRPSHSQMKCPYCRTITNKILPYFASYNHPLIYGVNSPERYALIINNCSYIYKSGKMKNQVCNKSACKSKFGTFCNSHYKMMEAKEKKKATLQNSKTLKKNTSKTNKKYKQEPLNNSIINLPEVDLEIIENTIVETFYNLDENSYKNKTIVELKKILRSNGCKVSGRKQELVDRIISHKQKNASLWIKHE